MPEPTLDYRSPGAIDAARLRSIQDHLRSRDLQHHAKRITMILGAIFLSALGPALLAAFASAIALKWRWDIGWWSIFAIASLIVVPLIYWTEWHTRGQFFMNELRAQGTSSEISETGVFRTSSYGEWELRTTAATWAAIIEVLLTAPRMMFSALHELKLLRAIGPVRQDRAADVLALLLGLDRGISPEMLLHPGENTADLAPVLAYLRLHDWIDIAKDGRRVWMLTEARARLAG